MKIYFTLYLLLATCFSAISQCGQKVICKSTVCRNVNGNDKQDDHSVDATITIDKDNIVLAYTMDGESETINCTIKKLALCDWQTYMKKGKSIYYVTADRGSHQEDTTIIVKGEDDKTTIYFGSDPDDKGGVELDVNEIETED